MAHKKGAGSSRNGRESESKRLGVKKYGGERMGYRDLQRICEAESGLNLKWFFDDWVRSSKYRQ